MLMPRLPHPNAYNTEMSIAMSMQHQQHHINQLLSTAAAGTGIVGDVDALLTPINANTSTSAARRPERNLWIPDEVMQMLNIMHSIGAVSLLNNKTVKSDMVFRRVEKMMHERGYRKKSQIQIWTKWKFLKSTYTTTKRNGTIPKMIPPPVYEMLKTMLDNVDLNGGLDNSECGNSVTSLDGDSSNGGNRLMISGVEGGYNSSNNQGTGESEDENTLGVAHPIFGFRLGSVKQEPADTGYENSTATGDNETVEENIVPTLVPCTDTNLQFPAVIKQEPPDTSSSPPPTAAQMPNKQPLMHSTPEMLISRNPVHVAATSSTPGNTYATITASQATTAQQQLNNAPEKTRPPIRIAPFAKVSSDNAINNVSLSPPPLHAAPTAPRPVRLNGVLNSANVSLNGSMQQNTTPQTTGGIRLPKGNTAHTRPIIMTRVNMPRLEQVHPRRTYSVRPERLLPDLDSATTTSPSELPPPMQRYENLYAEGPSTSQQALKLNNSQQKYLSTPTVGNKKRRLEIPWNDEPPKMEKIPRTCNKSNATAPPQLHGNRSEADDNANSENESFQHTTTQQPDDDGKEYKASQKEQEYFDNALKDLSLSLRQMQREMIEEFFNQQMEMARKEHQFQMRQDVLIMQAFMEQSKNFMKMAKKLMAGDLDDTLDSKEDQLKSKQTETHKPKTTKKTKVKSNMETAEASQASQALLNETMRRVSKQENTAEILDSEEDDNEDEDEQLPSYDNGNCNQHEQLEYEDDEYLQETSGDNDDNEGHNGGSVDDDDDDDDDDDVDAEASNAETSTRGDDDTDPIQMVTSELVEDV